MRQDCTVCTLRVQTQINWLCCLYTQKRNNSDTTGLLYSLPALWQMCYLLTAGTTWVMDVCTGKPRAMNWKLLMFPGCTQHKHGKLIKIKASIWTHNSVHYTEGLDTLGFICYTEVCRWYGPLQKEYLLDVSLCSVTYKNVPCHEVTWPGALVYYYPLLLAYPNIWDFFFFQQPCPLLPEITNFNRPHSMPQPVTNVAIH